MASRSAFKIDTSRRMSSARSRATAAQWLGIDTVREHEQLDAASGSSC